MKCPKCSYENKEGAAYCDLCKEVLIKTAEPIEKIEPNPPSNHTPNLKISLQKSYLILAVAIIFFYY